MEFLLADVRLLTLWGIVIIAVRLGPLQDDRPDPRYRYQVLAPISEDNPELRTIYLAETLRGACQAGHHYLSSRI